MDHRTLHTPLLVGGLMLCGLLALSDSHATDTLSFNIGGDIVTDCGIEPQAVVFDLGNVEISSLPSVGSTSAWVNGKLFSTGCAGVTSVKISLSGTADSTNPDLFTATGGSQGIGIEFSTEDGRAVVPNAAGLPWPAQAAGGSYGFRTRYVRTRPDVKTGPANATITVLLEHE